MKVDVLVGAQWGDEGKAKIVDVLAREYDLVVRYQGGANAGHTIQIGKQKIICHQVPSGVLYDHTQVVMANGMVIDLALLNEELAHLAKAGVDVSKRLVISDRAFLVLPHHRLLDAMLDNDQAKHFIGTTRRGIGPCYGDKIIRSGLRVGDLADLPTFREKLEGLLAKIPQSVKAENPSADEFNPSYVMDVMERDYRMISSFVKDTVVMLHAARAQGKRILLEGAQGTGLDIDFGSYPYVTSSSTTSGGAITGTGLPPQAIGRVFGIFKAYVTRVGEGAFPTELSAPLHDRLQSAGDERGATTGRARRCGWFDAVQARYAVMVSGINALVLTKIDILTGWDPIRVAIGYRINGKLIATVPARHAELAKAEPVYRDFPGWHDDLSQVRCFADLPQQAQDFIRFIENFLECPLAMLSTGPDRLDLITCRDKEGAFTDSTK